MSKVCPKCNKEWPDDFMACPLDGTPLISKPQPTGFSLNLGDANAISGGINMSDNHSIMTSDSHNVDSHNVTTHTVDSHNVITNNITQIEREKRPEEILLEKKQEYRAACQEVMKDGLITAESRIKLNNLQFNLGLDKTIAATIFDEVRSLSLQQRRLTTLGPVQKILINNIKSAIESNRVDLIERQLPQLKVIAAKYDVDEVQCLYYMLMAILHPAECVNQFEHQHEDRYWQTYWSSLAYRRIGDVHRSEEVFTSELEKWNDVISEENTFILAALNAVLDDNIDTVQHLLKYIEGNYSITLGDLVESIFLYINSNDIADIQNGASLFYGENLFESVRKRREKEIAIANAEAERKERAEAEKARILAEKARKEEDERLRIEEEAKLKAAEDAARLAEAKSREAEAERKRLEAEEFARKLEEERLLRIEKERRNKEKQEQIEAEKAAKEALLSRWPKFCYKCGNSVIPGQKFCNKCGTPIIIK